jgi:hypothetical protein
MGQASYLVVTQWGDKNLRFMLESAEGLAVDNTVAVTLKGSAHRAWLFLPEPAPRQLAFDSMGREALFSLLSHLANIELSNH